MAKTPKKHKPSPSLKNGGGARIDGSTRGIPKELWQEIKIMALINKTTAGHVITVGMIEYMKKHNGARKGDAK